MKFALPCALALLVAAGCTTTPDINYFTLDMRPAADAAPGVNIKVRRISVAEAIATKDIFIQISPIEVEYYATDQWVAGLDELVADKLRAEFGSAQPDKSTVQLEAELKIFGQADVPGGAEARVRLDVVLSLARNELEKTYEASHPAVAGGRTVNGVVIALTRCIEEIAAQIAADAQAL